MRASAISKMEVTPFAVSIPQAAQMIGRCPATVYELAGAKRIRAVKSDGRTLITVESLRAYIDSLPEAKIAPRPKRKPQHLRQAATLVPESAALPTVKAAKRKPSRQMETTTP
jgi:hypothetical protein